MLLTISTSHQPATELGYLLHKHPDKIQTFEITGGKAHVFYPEATESQCEAALLLDIDSLELVRTLKTSGNSLMLRHYVNDRPYVNSSFMSSAIAKVFSSALNGKCKAKPELTTQALPLQVTLSVLRVNTNVDMVERVFVPLGYKVTFEQHALEPTFAQWGQSQYITLQLQHTIPLYRLLAHLYVLLPVFDNDKHYWVSANDIENLLNKGKNWLPSHPEKEWITRRYLKNIRSLTKVVWDRLLEKRPSSPQQEINALAPDSLHQQRLEAVFQVLKKSKVKSVLDLGCGEGKLIKLLLKEVQFTSIVGMDVSFRELQKAKEKLYLDDLPLRQKQRVQLIQGSVTYQDKRFEGFDAAVLVEVIEHIDQERLVALEQVVFAKAQPIKVILTTPNAEYNSQYEFLEENEFRHDDHRFEWSRAEFEQWTQHVGQTYNYRVEISSIGEEDAKVGAPSQMAVFTLI